MRKQKIKIFRKNLKKVLTKILKSSKILFVSRHGRLAQLGEHLPYKQRVIGSIPIATTILFIGLMNIINKMIKRQIHGLVVQFG